MEDRWPGAFTAAVLACTNPRATIRTIVATDPRRYVVPLVLLAGVAGVLAPHRPRPFGVAGAALMPLMAVPVVWGLSIVLARVGRLLGGTADAVAVRAAMAWSGVPAILAFGVQLALAAAVGGEEVAEGFAARVSGQFSWLVGIWVWALNLIMLSEVHRFSFLRAFATAFLGSVVFALPIVVLVAVALVLATLGFHVGLAN